MRATRQSLTSSLQSLPRTHDKVTDPLPEGMGFSLALRGRVERRTYGRSYGRPRRPRPKVQSGIDISGCAIAASNTGEGRLIRPVPLVDHPAARATDARVTGIDADQQNAAQHGFVGHEAAKLPEGPVGQASSRTAFGRNPAANVRQVLQRQAPSGAFCGLNERLRNCVVRMVLEPPLLAGEDAQL